MCPHTMLAIIHFAASFVFAKTAVRLFALRIKLSQEMCYTQRIGSVRRQLNIDLYSCSCRCCCFSYELAVRFMSPGSEFAFMHPGEALLLSFGYGLTYSMRLATPTPVCLKDECESNSPVDPDCGRGGC